MRLTVTPSPPNTSTAITTINVRLVLSDGSTVNARNASSFAGVTFGNADRVTLEVLSGNSVQASGVTWYGGGDVEFRVCPIIYDNNGTNVQQVVVNPERNNGGDTLNIGTGAGLPRTINRGTAPNFFTFTAFQAPNQTYEDSRAPVRRTTFFDVDALDASSLNIASLASEPYYLDFKGPFSNRPSTLSPLQLWYQRLSPVLPNQPCASECHQLTRQQPLHRTTHAHCCTSRQSSMKAWAYPLVINLVSMSFLVTPPTCLPP